VKTTSIPWACSRRDQPVEQQLGDLGELLVCQRPEDDDLVDPVDELRAEAAAQNLHQLRFQLLERLAATGIVLDSGCAEVRGHDHDRVLEVDRSPLGVRQAAVVEDLEQDVEDVGVGLLDLVEEQHRVRPPPHLLGELPCLLVADVAGRRPTRRETVCRSWNSLMSKRTIRFSSPNKASASARASSVLPTPVGPRKRKLPTGPLRIAQTRRASAGPPLRPRRLPRPVPRSGRAAPLRV
jgi:hypothetical protein